MTDIRKDKTVGEVLFEHLKNQSIKHKGGKGVWYSADKIPPTKRYLAITLSDPLLFLTVQTLDSKSVSVLHLGFYDADRKAFCERHGDETIAFQESVTKWYMFPMPQ